MLKPTSGTATMAGWDIVKEPEKVRSSIGILSAEKPDFMTG